MSGSSRTPTRVAPKLGLSRVERLLGLSGAALLAAMLLLFHAIKIDGAVIASGTTVVVGKVREVQSLDGGIVREILVSDGDKVVAGQVLLRLDSSILDINREILRARLSELLARRARLDAEVRDLATVALLDPPPNLDPALLIEHLEGQEEIFFARRAVQESRRLQLEERIRQADGEATGLTARIAATQTQIDLLHQEIAKQQDLVKRGLIPARQLLDNQSRLAALEGEIETLRANLAGTRNAVRDAELKIVQGAREFREAVSTELREVSAAIEETRLELARTDNQLQRLDIVAPTAGVVHEMQLATVGGVVQPQATILRVVPVADGVTFDLQIAPEAIDTVYVGQMARIMFPAFDASTTPEIFGAIARISPDSIVDPSTGQRYYQAQLSIATHELSRLGDKDLPPGLPVQAFLMTQSRSVLEYLIRPLADHIALAFREG